VPVSGRADGSDADVEHNMKSTNVMSSMERVKATVLGIRWLQEEGNRDGTRLAQEDRSSRPSTCFEKISPLPGRSHVGSIYN
jgi:hypothetical protein